MGDWEENHQTDEDGNCRMEVEVEEGETHFVCQIMSEQMCRSFNLYCIYELLQDKIL